MRQVGLVWGRRTPVPPAPAPFDALHSPTVQVTLLHGLPAHFADVSRYVIGCGLGANKGRAPQAGDLVAVWRRGHGLPQRRGQARRRGPGIILGVIRRNYWAAIPGCVLKASPDQLRAATDDLGAVVGAVDTEAVLDVLFADFCIGK